MTTGLPQWVQDALLEGVRGNTTNLEPQKPSRAAVNPHLYNMFRRSVDRCRSIAMNEELMGYPESASAYHLMAAEIIELAWWAASEGAGPVAPEQPLKSLPRLPENIAGYSFSVAWVDEVARFGEQDRGRIEGTLD